MLQLTIGNLRAAVVAAAISIVSVAPLESRSTAEEGKPPGDAADQSKLDLTPESSASLLALGRPSDSEWRHLRVAWLTDVVAARRKAAEEDKPMVICYTGGAGYNEPLGVC